MANQFGQPPSVPDPTKIARSGQVAASAVAKGAMSVGSDLTGGIENILFNTIGAAIKSLERGATDLVGIIKSDVDSGRRTVDQVMGEVDRTANEVLRQVDEGIGQEVVSKFKQEVERQLR